MSPHEVRCCCHRIDCDYLQHNQHIILDLERDVSEAGRVGQALLERHEKHVEESAHERGRLLSAMDVLERKKDALEASNASIIQENRGLLDQLEEMNNAIVDSDQHISSLTTTLESTRHEIQRLSSLAQKATQLEVELTMLEAERAKLDSELATNQQDHKSAVQRWRRAESTIGQLQDQIQGMEKEARDERSRHDEVLARIERQRSVNVHLASNAATARASGAIQASAHQGSGGGVVTHFVRDILHDNSNLQLGILELKELLSASNAEVTNLRGQLDIVQPNQGSESEAQTLDAEMKASSNSEIALDTVPELHVHHHYHQQRQVSRKPRKRRPALPTGHLLRFPSSSVQEGQDSNALRGYGSAAATILSNTSVSIPASHRPRWSMQSTATDSSYAPSSFSTSPRQAASVFDSFDATFDSTRPTTPSSSAPGSPLLQASREYLCERDFHPEPSPFSALQLSHIRQRSYVGDVTIPEEQENSVDWGADSAESEAITPKPSRHDLRRVMSHDSLLSISGMDIHATSRSFNSLDHKNPLHLVTAASSVTTYSSPAVTSTTAISSTIEKPTTTSSDIAKRLLSHHSHPGSQQGGEGKRLTKRMGGWVFGKWGAAPTSSSSVDDLRARAAASSSTEDDDYAAMAAVFRSPGINQPGPILGLPKPRRTPSNVQPIAVNTDLLHESLQQSIEQSQ